MISILHVIGARPNFVKAAAVIDALDSTRKVVQKIVHTGQHYDPKISEVFFQELEIPKPDFNLQVGSGSHAAQTSEIMSRFEPIVMNQRPDLVLVYGDVNSTLAAALVCAKVGIRVAHVEAGLRSFDRTMPEEINRLLTDQIADYLFTPSEDDDRNLAKEGIAPDRVHRVGNVMIDTLARWLPKALEQKPADLLPRYALVTLHRPSNVDDVRWLESLFNCLVELSKDLPVLFAMHPRTRERLDKAGLAIRRDRFRLMNPVPYLTFLALEHQATVVITDSGGVQEETTFLNVPCLTVRENTERPITVSLGTNELVGRDLNALSSGVRKVCAGQFKKGRIPPLWDGKASQRIASILVGESVNQPHLP
jgi:UDP-N-acetylglucosamine 2-epimerase (non-hydrolysing)